MIAFSVLTMICLCCVVIGIATCARHREAASNHGRRRDVIIVLGYPARNDGTVPPILRERIRRAVDLYHKGIAAKIVCTGAAVANGYVEADVMARALADLGVPRSSIIPERLAKGTWENLVNSKGIMQINGMKTAVIVSSPWHLRKASSYAFALGIDHTVEGSAYPREYFPVGIGLIYLYMYGQMFMNDLWSRVRRTR